VDEVEKLIEQLKYGEAFVRQSADGNFNHVGIRCYAAIAL